MTFENLLVFMPEVKKFIYLVAKPGIFFQQIPGGRMMRKRTDRILSVHNLPCNGQALFHVADMACLQNAKMA